jgi:hypothetical protein
MFWLLHILLNDPFMFPHTAGINGLIFQDGTPPQFGTLNSELSISSFLITGSIPRLLRSPDLSPMNYYYCGCVKDGIYSEKVKCCGLATKNYNGSCYCHLLCLLWSGKNISITSKYTELY